MGYQGPDFIVRRVHGWLEVFGEIIGLSCASCSGHRGVEDDTSEAEDEDSAHRSGLDYKVYMRRWL